MEKNLGWICKCMDTSFILTTTTQVDYELLDTGDGEKLERYGEFRLRRPDPQALWGKRLSETEWNKVNASFSRDEKRGGWNVQPGLPERWLIEFGGLKLYIRPTAFKHTGLFPEQLPNWEWMRNKLKVQNSKIKTETKNQKSDNGD